MKSKVLSWMLFLAVSISLISCSGNCTGACCAGGEGTVFACSLSAGDLAERKEEIKEEVFSKITRKEEIEKGYRLYFENQETTLQAIKKFIKAEQKCCPFFKFDLKETTENQEIELKIEVPEGGRAFLKELVTELS